MESYLDSKDDLFFMLTEIRSVYTVMMDKPDFSLTSLSYDGTIIDTISEVCSCKQVV